MYVKNKNIENTERIKYEECRYEYLRLDLNENPGGLSQEFINEVLSEVTPVFLSQYPEMAGFTRAYASFLGVLPENLCLVNGSSEGIRFVIEGFTTSGGRIVGVAPSYAMYEVYASMYGREFIPVRYGENLEMPVENIIGEITPDTQLLILLNPNNPIGNVYSDEEMDRLMSAAFNNEVTVLIDEAYHYIYPNTFLHFALEHDNVFVTRTFSKLFSLAGCRLGCVIGRSEGIHLVQKLCTPHNVNAFAMLFAQAVFEHPNILNQLIEGQVEGKAYLQLELDRRGYEYVGSEGNFMFLKPRTDANHLVERMRAEKRILVKSYSGIGHLGNCLRVTTAEKQYMEQFLIALDELDAIE